MGLQLDGYERYSNVMEKLPIDESRPPLYLSAGIHRGQVEIERLAIEESLAMQIVGPYSVSSWPGHDRGGNKRFHYDAISGAAYNSIGLENPGYHAASEYLQTSINCMHTAGQVAMVSTVALPHENPELVLPVLAEWSLYMGADAIEIDASCPTVGDPLLCEDINRTGEIVERVRQAIGHDAILSLKVGPLQKGTTKKYCEAELPINYIDCINTKQVPMPRDPCTKKPLLEVDKDFVGMSGPAIQSLAKQNVKMWVNGPYRVLSVGGITDGQDAYERVHDMGAEMAGLGQGVYRAVNPRRFIQRIAQEYIEATP